MSKFDRLKERVRAVWCATKRCLKRLLHRLVTETGYAGALASAVVSAVSLTCLRPAVARFVRDRAQTFAAFIRSQTRSSHGYPEIGWDDIEPAWE